MRPMLVSMRAYQPSDSSRPSGISTVILPACNMAELKEIPGEIARKINFIGVSHMDEVLKAALERMPTCDKSKVRSAPATSPRTGVAAAKSSD